MSPHAHLHEIAASLAINHTEFFFNQIRKEIGDKEFAQFLKLKKLKNGFRDYLNKYFEICAAHKNGVSIFYLMFVLVALIVNKYFIN